jgi:hypothetical protein
VRPAENTFFRRQTAPDQLHRCSAAGEHVLHCFVLRPHVMGGPPICLFCLLVKPCDCPSGPTWRAEGAAAALRDMNSAAVVLLFRRVLEATMGPGSVAVFYAAVCSKDKPGLRSIGGAMLADRSFAPLVQTILKETLTDDIGDKGMTRMVGHILQAYTQALCAAVQPSRTPSA